MVYGWPYEGFQKIPIYQFQLLVIGILKNCLITVFSIWTMKVPYKDSFFLNKKSMDIYKFSLISKDLACHKSIAIIIYYIGSLIFKQV
jgi:hypothetical protein